MGAPVLFCTICYYPFHGSSKSLLISISDFKVFPNYLRPHISCEHFFLSPHVISLYILLEKLLSFSPNILSVNHFRSVTEMDPEN